MGNEVTRKTVLELDGFSGYTSACEGDDEINASNKVIMGTKLKFLDPHWWNTSTEQIMTGTALILIDVKREVIKWGHDSKPLLPPQILAPGQKFPDFEKLNDKCNKSEWRERFGKMVGPWSGQNLLYFVDDFERLNRFTWPSPITTIGSAICVDEVVDQIALVRRIKGQNLYPVTVLGHTNFKNDFGPRQRPYLLNIPHWVTYGTAAQKTLPDNNQTGGALPAPRGNPEAPPSGTAGTPAGTQPVSKPTAKEVTGDEIKY
jgi:hypothetical protein